MRFIRQRPMHDKKLLHDQKPLHDKKPLQDKKPMPEEKPMFFKLKKPQSLDMGLLGMDAAEEAGVGDEGRAWTLAVRLSISWILALTVKLMFVRFSATCPARESSAALPSTMI